MERNRESFENRRKRSRIERETFENRNEGERSRIERESVRESLRGESRYRINWKRTMGDS
jgi:hypothetical protein